MKLRFAPAKRYQSGVNLDFVENWKVEPALKNGQPIPESEGFFVRLYMNSGKELLYSSAEGGRELLEALQDEYFPIFDQTTGTPI